MLNELYLICYIVFDIVNNFVWLLTLLIPFYELKLIRNCPFEVLSLPVVYSKETNIPTFSEQASSYCRSLSYLNNIFIKVKIYGINNAYETIPIDIQEEWQVKQWNKVFCCCSSSPSLINFSNNVKSEKILYRSSDRYFCADLTQPMFGLHNSQFKQTRTKGISTIRIYALQLSNWHLEKSMWSDGYVDSPVTISPRDANQNDVDPFICKVGLSLWKK